MTVQEIREAAKVMEAYANGKKIQCNDNRLGNGEWVTTDNPSFNWDKYAYRIKPESRYRPFKSQEECWEEMLKHQPFGWLKGIEDKREVVHIGRVFEVKGITLITLSINEGINNNSSYFFNEYTFADGTPFGIREEQ